MYVIKNSKGTDLAKVLYYYGLIPGVDSDEQKIVCPFHNDLNPSMKVDLVNGSWYCFGCGLSGDAPRFVHLVEKDKGLNELESYKKFYKILKSRKVEHIDMSRRRAKPKNFTKCLLEAEDFYYGLLTVDWTKKPEDEDIKNAALYMKNRGFTFKALNMCGCKYTYQRNYPLVFPMTDNGTFKGWVCRTTDKRIEAKRKYLYNEGFSRRNTLCGDYHKEDGPLYIVEGYMDRLKLMSFGVKNVVAILGWKITAEQIQKLKKQGFTHVISTLDNDTCGKKGSEYLKNYFEVTRFTYLKGIKDPGEMNQELFDKMNSRTLKFYNEKEKEKKCDGRTFKQNQKRR